MTTPTASSPTSTSGSSSESPRAAAAVPAAVFDPARLAAVGRTGLLDTGPEEQFDRLARLAATLLGTPFAFVTIVDDTRSFWKSCIGVDSTDPAARQNTVEQSFCKYVIGADTELIVPDTRADERTRDNPSIDLMGVAAWAGFPIRSPNGLVLGTFSAADTFVRDWTPHDVELLRTLSHAASGEIALREALDEANAAAERAEYAAAQAAELAHTLQESLLPDRLPPIPGVQVAARYRRGAGHPQHRPTGVVQRRQPVPDRRVRHRAPHRDQRPRPGQLRRPRPGPGPPRRWPCRDSRPARTDSRLAGHTPAS
jgi:hypothetical protein